MHALVAICDYTKATQCRYARYTVFVDIDRSQWIKWTFIRLYSWTRALFVMWILRLANTQALPSRRLTIEGRTEEKEASFFSCLLKIYLVLREISWMDAPCCNSKYNHLDSLINTFFLRYFPSILVYTLYTLTYVHPVLPRTSFTPSKIPGICWPLASLKVRIPLPQSGSLNTRSLSCFSFINHSCSPYYKSRDVLIILWKKYMYYNQSHGGRDFFFFLFNFFDDIDYFY